MELSGSETKLSLMRAFAGECQSNARYTMAAQKAASKNLYVIQEVFKFTAQEELAHARVFYELLSELSGQKLTVNGDYPVMVNDDPAVLLRDAQKHEYDEYSSVYEEFAKTACEEGFTDIGAKFRAIAAIEKTHSERFEKFACLLEQNKLFVSDVEEEWICLNCGHRLKSTEAPSKCPVCSHPKGYFIRVTLAPYTNG